MPVDSNMKDDRFAGKIIILAVAFIVLCVLSAQHLYPGYNLNTNYISDLGVGSTAAIFNTGIRLFGVLILLAAYFIHRAGKHSYLALGFAVAAIGAIGIGTFPETTGYPHLISADLTFGTIAIMAIAAYRLFRKPASYYSLASGLLSLLLIIGFAASAHAGVTFPLGFGHGGVEEILFYNELIWSIVIAISLIKGRF